MKKIVVVSVVVNIALVLMVSFMSGRINYLEKYNLALQSRNTTQAHIIEKCRDEFIRVYHYDWIQANSME